MTINEIHSSSIEDAIRTLESLAIRHDETVFRGHKNVAWRLDSTLKRHTTRAHEEWDDHIEDMLTHFVFNLRSIGKDVPFQGLPRRHCLEYGRHYGIPTPLIDFSYSPYVALFFAFNGIRPTDAKAGEEVVIYALDMGQLADLWGRFHQRSTLGAFNAENYYEVRQQFLYESGRKSFEKNYPANELMYFATPASWNRRMLRQMGVFLYDTVDWTKAGFADLEDFIGKESETKEADGNTRAALTKIYIPHSEAGKVFRRLELANITGTRILDDHEGALADVLNAYSYNRKTGYAWDISIPPPDDDPM